MVEVTKVTGLLSFVEGIVVVVVVVIVWLGGLWPVLLLVGFLDCGMSIVEDVICIRLMEVVWFGLVIMLWRC